MPTRLITPPAALAVSLESAKANLRIDDTDSDALITEWLQGITAHAEHYTGRSFINQTWRVTLDTFPTAIELPPPVVSVSNIKYLDEAGVEQTLDPADYFVDTVQGYAVPAVGKAWPATYDRINAVTVDVVSGYGATDATIPPAVKSYILAKLGECMDPAMKYESTVRASYIDRLLDGVKVFS